MSVIEKFPDLFPKTIFAVSLVASYVLFGGLNGHVETTFAFAIGIGFLIGREFYKAK